MHGETVSHYRIAEELGRGGMGVVYRAEDVRLHRPVALKLLPADLSDHPDAIDRMRREARIASALNDPRICTIHEISEDEGRPFIVMELLEGENLRSAIDGKPMDITRAVDLAMEIAEGLAGRPPARDHPSRHQAGEHLRHEPTATRRSWTSAWRSCCTIRASPCSLGSSAPTASAAQTLSQSGTPGGTAAYMSPEQARGETARQPIGSVFARRRALRDGDRASAHSKARHPR